MTRLILTILLSLPAFLSVGKPFSPVAKVTEQERYTIVHDYLGTPAEAYDADGNEVWSRTLNMNGEVIEENGNIGMIPFLFQGQYYDGETGLAYNRFRYYSPQMGMYVSQDPIGLDGGIFNLYGYVNDTNIWIDIWGLKYGPGRKGKQKRLKDLLDNPGARLPKYLIGWLKQEENAIRTKHRNQKGNRKKTLRNPPGYELAHRRGYEASKGFGYEHADLNTEANHSLQHKYDKFGRLNKPKTREFDIDE